jgi:Domain of unknown function (DUF4124)
MYRWVDAQGTTHYSDSPQPGAEVVHVQPVQTYKAPATAATASTASASSNGGARSTSSGTVLASCSIASPQPDQSFFSPDSVAVSVSVNPPMQEGDQLQVSFDGTEVPPTIDQVIIQQPSRGSHTVAAIVRGADGKVRCSTNPVSFNVQRASVNSPQSPQAHSPARGH